MRQDKVSPSQVTELQTPTTSKLLGDYWIWKLAFLVSLGWLPAILARGTIARTSRLLDLSLRPNPYFHAQQAWLLYLATPLVVISAFLLFLSPGGILVLAYTRVRNVAEWIVLAFGASILLAIVLGTSAKAILGLPLTWTILGPLWLITALVGWLILAIRSRKHSQISWPFTDYSDRRRILWLVGTILIGVIALLPKLFWENFNLDGIEAFEFGRSLTTNLLPRWEMQDGVFGFYQNFFLFAYPNHWFISLFGPIEAAVRLPFILYLTVLLCALFLLIEHKQQRKLQLYQEASLWLGLALFTLVQTYNTNYEPFFADIAEMATTDTLWITCFAVACYALWSDRPVWFWLFALMTYSASPGGLLLLGALTAAIFLVRPKQWRKQTRLVIAVVTVCVGINLVYALWYKPTFIGDVNDQFSAFNMLRRLYPPTLSEFVRLNALIFPSGILPALSLLAVRRREPYSLIIALVTLGYFVIVYIQAWTSLHQFTPVMVLPLVVLWRLLLSNSKPFTRWLVPILVGTTVLSMILSLPRHFQINQATREFGLSTSFEIGDYERDYEEAAVASRSLFTLLPEGYRLQYPEQPWGTDPLSWLYYATREKPADQRINYVIAETTQPAPPDTVELASQDGVSVYVRDLDIWQRDRERDEPQVVVSPLYEPILRRTFQFFHAYSQATQGEAQE